jgi:uncharacterized protein YndB with AHSA1/START domain
MNAMKNIGLTLGVALVWVIAFYGCSFTRADSDLPKADKFVQSPLRNRIKLELNAPPGQVWELVGNPARMPEYSVGLQSVVTEMDSAGKYNSYTCHFKPTAEAEPGIVHRSNVVWFEPTNGWASLDVEPNAFGLQQSLTLIILEKQGDKTIVTWDQHFTGTSRETIEMNVRSLEQALNDIARNLTVKFGGRVLVNFSDKESH